MSDLQIELRHLEAVRRILGPLASKARVYGSRARGSARRFSDLDLVIVGEVGPRELASLRSEFEDSDLPYKVDLAAWSELDPSFQQQIAKDLRPIV